MSESWHCRCRWTGSIPTSSTRSRSWWPCRRTTGWRAQQHQGRRPARRDAAAARRRPLPARPGARHLLEHRRAREAGLPRHQPRDAAPDGGRGRRHHAAARARRAAAPTATRAASPSSLSRNPCRRAPSAPCGASRARGARSSSRSRSRSRRTRCESPAAVRSCAAPDGRELAAHWFAARSGAAASS